MTVRVVLAGSALVLSLGSIPLAADAADPAAKGRRSPSARGSAVFEKYCVLCHGANAEGDGVAAKYHNPRPANLTMSALSDAQKEAIIREGGAGVGRSRAMPPWRQELDDRQIADLIAYLGTLRKAKR